MIMQLDAEHYTRLQLWLVALRSGEYVQGTNRLEKMVPSATQHCCLGVLCRVAMANGLEGVATSRIEQNGLPTYTVFSDGQGGSGAFPPLSVLAWLVGGELAGEMPLDELTDMNDSQLWTFEQIADWLESIYVLEEVAR